MEKAFLVLRLQFLLAIATGAALTSGMARAQCSPFGNPPQQLLGFVKPKCSGGKVLGPFKDSDGTPRYSCLFEPPTASTKKPLPLVVFIHPSTVSADSVAFTNLSSFLKSADVSDDPAKPGFILMAPEGRNTTHLYGPPGTFDSTGLGWDVWYRQMSPSGDVTIDGTVYPENVDAAAIDHFIAQEVATGKVDTNRIYLTGWSNGASMAIVYGLLRPNIAAIAPYSGPSPFGYALDACYQTPVAGAATDDTELSVVSPTLPMDHVHNNCDIGGSCPNAEWTVTQFLQIGSSVQDTIINSPQAPTNACDPTCGDSIFGSFDETDPSSTGVKNHTRWPSNWTPAMLDFFRRHPLNGRPQ